jgi:hypothetical protein
VAVIATLDDSDTSNDQGIWATSGGVLDLIAREGQVAPGAGVRVFRQFQFTALSDSGHVAFIGYIDAPGGGVDGGLWIWDGEALSSIAIPDEIMEVDTGDFRTVDDVVFLGANEDSDRHGRGLNGAGQLAFLATFTDDTVGIFLASFDEADISLEMAGTLVKHNKVSYTLTVHNGGPDDAINVALTDALPATPKKVKIQSISAGCVYDEVSHSVTCDAPVLPVDTSLAFDIEIQLKGVQGDITNQASVSSGTFDPDSNNNDVTLELQR